MFRYLAAALLLLYSSPVYSQTYFLNGSAISLGDDCYMLTPAIGTMNGTVWYADQIDLNNPFDLQFTMNFGTLDANGADGMCFVLQTVGTNAIGASGGGMGYQTFGTSLGIEFDTYQNGNFGDPSEDHIAIEYNGNINHGAAIGHVAGPVQASPTNVNIEDGEDHVVRVTWNPETQLVQVYFDCEFRLEGTIDLINTIFGGESLVYWGFTAATGGSYNFQTVCLREDILNESEVSICNGASTELNVASSFDGVYSWTPTDYLSDPTIGNPVATPPSTMTYTASFLDICGNPTQTEITVQVEDLEVTVSNISTLSCINQSIDVDAQINMDLSGIYTWTLGNDVVSSEENADVLNITEPGNYTLEVNVQDACFAEATFEVPANFSVYEINAGDDLVLNCINEEVTVIVETNGGNNVVWLQNNEPLIGENSLTLIADEPGTYTVITTHAQSGCLAEDEVVITENFATPIITAGAQDSLTCLDPIVPIENINISSSNGYGIQWTTFNGNILYGETGTTPLVNQLGDYTITVTDNITGCTSQATVFVGESDDYGFDISELVFPNIITPNNDAENRYWQPYTTSDREKDLSSIFSLYDLTIFNRWGKVVFESTSFNKPWDGQDLEEGTYFYILHYESYCSSDGKLETHGNIFIAR